MSQAELVRELEGFGFERKEPMGSRSYQTQKTTSEDVVLIALAGSTGLEPATSDVTGRRSNQTELTPQAVVRVCFRSRALRGLVYTEACPVRNNFFENIFWALREGLRGRLARVKFAALQYCARRKALLVLSFACGTRDKLNPRQPAPEALPTVTMFNQFCGRAPLRG